MSRTICYSFFYKMFQDTWVKYWLGFLIGHQSSWMKGSSDNLNFGWIFNRWGSPGFYCGVWKKWAHLIIWTVWIFNRRLQPLAFCIFSRGRSSRFQECQAHLSIREQWWRGVEGLWVVHVLITTCWSLSRKGNLVIHLTIRPGQPCAWNSPADSQNIVTLRSIYWTRPLPVAGS